MVNGTDLSEITGINQDGKNLDRIPGKQFSDPMNTIKKAETPLGVVLEIAPWIAFGFVLGYYVLS